MWPFLHRPPAELPPPPEPSGRRAKDKIHRLQIAAQDPQHGYTRAVLALAVSLAALILGAAGGNANALFIIDWLNDNRAQPISTAGALTIRFVLAALFAILLRELAYRHITRRWIYPAYRPEKKNRPNKRSRQ